MSSELKTNKISPATGTALTLADSGDTLTLPSGATLSIASGATITNSGTATGFGGDNTPAFSAYVGSDQSLSHDTSATLACTEEYFDTDSAFNNTASGNAYSFTVPSGEGGKYFIHAVAYMSAGNSQSNATQVALQINGTALSYQVIDNSNNYGDKYSNSITEILDLSAGDYVQVNVYGTTASSGAFTILGNQGSNKHYSWFMGYKLIGV